MPTRAGRRCLAELERASGDAPSKQKRGRKAVPPACDRAEAAMSPSGVEDRVASDQLGSRPRMRSWLLRKEVIQPHLPVRLPCYDFTPIADPTFDSSFPKG